MPWSLGFTALFWLLLQFGEPAAPRCAKSLGYKFTITATGQPRCEIQGLVNGNIFLSYTCYSEKVKLFSVQGMKVNATEAWNEQNGTLKHVLEELRKKDANIKANITVAAESLSLQANMMCRQESNGHSSASWEFGFNGQISLRFDSKSRSWTVLEDEGRLKKTLASDGAMTELLVRTSTGNCREWLKQVLYHQDGVLSTTAAPTIDTDTARSKATTKMADTAIIPVILTCFIIAVVLCVSLQ